MALKNEEARVEELRRDGRASEAEARVLNRADGSENVPCGGPKALRTGGGADWSESVPERSCLDCLGSIFSGAMDWLRLIFSGAMDCAMDSWPGPPHQTPRAQAPQIPVAHVR